MKKMTSAFYLFLALALSSPSFTWALQPIKDLDIKEILTLNQGGLRFEYLDSEKKRDQLVDLYLQENKEHLKYYWGKPLSPLNDDFLKGNIQYMYDLSQNSLNDFKLGTSDKFSKIEYLIYNDKNDLIGNIGVYNHNGTDEGAIAIYISSKFKGQNLGTKATEAFLKEIKGKFVMENIYWECISQNAASNYLAKKMGFVHYVTNILDEMEPESEYGKEEVYKKNF